MMGKQGLAVAVVAVVLSGCAALEKGGGYAANPIVVGAVNVGSSQQCEAYAKSNADDAKALRAYLAAMSSAVNGCASGIDAGLAEAAKAPAAR